MKECIPNYKQLKKMNSWVRTSFLAYLWVMTHNIDLSLAKPMQFSALSLSPFLQFVWVWQFLLLFLAMWKDEMYCSKQNMCRPEPHSLFIRKKNNCWICVQIISKLVKCHVNMLTAKNKKIVHAFVSSDFNTDKKS